MNVIVVLVVLAFLLFGGAAYAMTKGFNISRWDRLSKSWAKIRENLQPEEIKAIIMIESSGNETAVNPADPSWGLMGITALIGNHYAKAGTKELLFDPNTNIKAGSGFLSDLKRRYAEQYPLGSGNGWVQMYNTGEPKFLKKGVRNRSYENKFVIFTEQFKKDFQAVV